MLPFRLAAADLIIGAVCAGCGTPAITLCVQCRPEFIPAPREAWPNPIPEPLLHPTRVRPFASASHHGAVRAALAQYKEEGQFGLLRTLGHMLAASACAAAPADGRIVLVPIPSSRMSNARRGYDAVGELAREAASSLRGIGLDCRVQRGLRQARKVADQSGLGARERPINMADALTLRSTWGLEGRAVIVVDDIITTGASLAEAVRVLHRAGFRPAGLAVVAATERRSCEDRATFG